MVFEHLLEGGAGEGIGTPIQRNIAVAGYFDEAQGGKFFTQPVDTGNEV